MVEAEVAPIEDGVELRPEPPQAAVQTVVDQMQLVQVEVGVAEDPATLMDPHLMPVESIGNLERELGTVPIATTVPGETLRAPGHAITETSSLKCPK